MGSPVIILDRDGVINHDSAEYIKTPDEWRPIPGSIEAIAALAKQGFRVVVATNQSGLARGLFDHATLDAIHHKMLAAVAEEGGEIADIFYCPHGPGDGCVCRKPRPGLLFEIAERYEVDLAETPFVGDSRRDLLAAQAAGARPVLVLTGNGQRTLDSGEVPSDVEIHADLARFAERMLNQECPR